jgi:hypothetical protein
VAIAAALLTITACSSDTSKPAAAQPADAATTTDTAAADLEQAVRDYTAAYFKPDPDTGYAMLSERCQADINQTFYTAQLEQASKDYGQLNVETVTVDQISGDLARVSYGMGLPILDQKSQPWVNEAGAWRFDAC